MIVPTRNDRLLHEALNIQYDEADDYLLDKLNTSEITGRELLSGSDGPNLILPNEDVVLDLLELLHAECVSAPASIGISDHGDEIAEGPFDQAEGQQRFRDRLNPALSRHTPPLQMRPTGEIIERPPTDIQTLVDEPIPESIESELSDPIDAAIDRFYRRGATDMDRVDALRHLAAVLERLRSTIKTELASKDESALFEIANRFGIRHHDRTQRGDYDKDIWLEWIFHVYLATARALIRVQQRDTIE